MTVEEAMKFSKLPIIEAELLAAHVLDTTRTDIFVRRKEQFSEESLKSFYRYVQRRKAHEPIAYILESKEFYGRPFHVDSDVLIPRPATEYLVEGVKKFFINRQDLTIDADTDICILARPLRDGKIETILDAGTGSGNVVVTLSIELPGYRYIGIDNSKPALTIAESNAKKLYPENRIEWRSSDITQFIEEHQSPFLIVSNPPYIPLNAQLDPDVKGYEPHRALFSGEDGLDVIRPMVNAARANTYCKGFVIECRSDQVATIDNLLRNVR